MNFWEFAQVNTGYAFWGLLAVLACLILIIFSITDCIEICYKAAYGATRVTIKSETKAPDKPEGTP